MLHLSEAQTNSAVGSTQDEFLLRSSQGQDLLFIAMHLQKMADMAESKLTVSIALCRWALPREKSQRRREHVPKEIEIVSGRPILLKV